MKKEVILCEHCGAQADEHPYDEIGWVVLSDCSISLTEGRKQDGMAKTKYRSAQGDSMERHFCSIAHLVAYIRHEKYEAPPQLA